MLTWKKVLLAMWVMVTCLVACGDMAEAQVYSFTKEDKPLVFLPFQKGTVVRIPQGNNGTFTHKGKYAYAYDFDMGDTSASTSNPIYGVDLYSPLNGELVSAVHSMQDFSCMSSSCNGGWGNTVVIKPDGANYYLRLNHLKYNSIPSKFRVGRSGGAPVRVKQGEKVGQVGHTGISTHPHLDMSLVTAYNTADYQSIEFDFVEGPAEQYAWLYSELEEDKMVLDNSGRVNLGAEVEVVGIYTNTQNWSSYSLPDVTSYSYDYYTLYYLGSHIHGDNFWYTFDQGGWFAWAVNHTDVGSNWMAVESNCYEADQMTEKVFHRWSNNGRHEDHYTSQQDGINHVTFHEPVAYDRYFGGTQSIFYMQNRSTSGKPMCVDSLVLYKNPS